MQAPVFFDTSLNPSIASSCFQVSSISLLRNPKSNKKCLDLPKKVNQDLQSLRQSVSGLLKYLKSKTPPDEEVGSTCQLIGQALDRRLFDR
jgi:hypothetical protein